MNMTRMVLQVVVVVVFSLNTLCHLFWFIISLLSFLEERQREVRLAEKTDSQAKTRFCFQVI